MSVSSLPKPSTPPRSTYSKGTASKPAGDSSLSISTATPCKERLLIPAMSPLVEEDSWLKVHARVEIYGEVVLKGYQLYIVPRWLLERVDIPLIVIFTGDEKDVVTVYSIGPFAELDSAEGLAEVQYLAGQTFTDGSHPKQTEFGTISVTSLASFPPDLTPIRIPAGDYRALKESVYVSCNLVRFHCAGRASITPEQPPSAATRYKFVQQYHLPDNGSISADVLQLVKLVQTCLALFGMYGTTVADLDGLFCDKTVEALEMWSSDVGEYWDKNEHVQCLSPEILSALLSTVWDARQKLDTLGFEKLAHDPFVGVQDFQRALIQFQKQQRIFPAEPYLRVSVIRSLSIAESYRQQSIMPNPLRMVRDKIGDLTTTLVDDMYSRSANAGVGDLRTDDITTFVKNIIKAGRDGIPTLRFVWTGKGRIGREKPEKGDHNISRGGLLKGVTVKTGQVLKDGVMGWSKRGNVADDQSDSEPSLHQNLPLPPHIKDIPTVHISVSGGEEEQEAPPQVDRSISVSLLGANSAVSSAINLHSDGENASTTSPRLTRAGSPLPHFVNVPIFVEGRWKGGFGLKRSDSCGVTAAHPGHKISREIKRAHRRRSFSSTQDWYDLKRESMDRLRVDKGLFDTLYRLKDHEANLAKMLEYYEALLQSQTQAEIAFDVELKARTERHHQLKKQAEDFRFQDPQATLLSEKQNGDNDLPSLNLIEAEDQKLVYALKQLKRDGLHLPGDLEALRKRVETLPVM